MPVLNTSRYPQAIQVLTAARSRLADPAGYFFSDAILIPFLNQAYFALQLKLELNAARVMKQTTGTDANCPDLVLKFTNGLTQTVISDTSTPQLPVDCLVPERLYEKITAQTTDTFQPMHKWNKGGDMQNLQPSQFLNFWSWNNDEIRLIGATQPITVRMDYVKSKLAIIMNTDPITIPHVINSLAAKVTELAAESRGAAALAATQSALWEAGTEELKNRYVRPGQTRGLRRHPYGRRKKVVYL